MMLFLVQQVLSLESQGTPKRAHAFPVLQFVAFLATDATCSCFPRLLLAMDPGKIRLPVMPIARNLGFCPHSSLAHKVP